ncbi:DUF4041 domain-containing protein [Clostridium estertheticum]|uniref:DUF4041 domain-containing protein n=1 Tax=Clostridium estertheticum TaxID=238834 RepID=UPI0013E94174|nr:DUF4041 domain-containing protein [Clostridium estertheticum]MBZ9689389.1 DUF4041 domain-containing protein [Clostridium estertheticum]
MRTKKNEINIEETESSINEGIDRKLEIAKRESNKSIEYEKAKFDKYRSKIFENIEVERVLLLNNSNIIIQKKNQQYKFLLSLYKIMYQKIQDNIDSLKKEEKSNLDEYRTKMIKAIEVEKVSLSNALNVSIEEKNQEYEIVCQKVKDDINNLKNEEEIKFNEYRRNVFADIEVTKVRRLNELTDLNITIEEKNQQYKIFCLKIEADTKTKENYLMKEVYERVKKEYQRYNFLYILIKILYQKVNLDINNLNSKGIEIKIKESNLKYYCDKIANGKMELLQLNKDTIKLEYELNEIRRDISLDKVGFYETKYTFENSTLYQEKLEVIRKDEKELVLHEKACICNDVLSVIHTTAMGKSMIYRYIQLMLRTFNDDCYSIIANVSYKNINLMDNKIDKAYDFINEAGDAIKCRVTYEYFQFKKKELYLVFEYQEKLYQEKEEQRIIREQMVDEEKAQKEFEKALIESENESIRYGKALEQARAELANTTGSNVIKLQKLVIELESKLQEAEDNKRAISQAQITKSGHIYIISNIGSFGENVYKIGMTRRINPDERIYELSGPSVPFPFDVHAKIFTKNAPELEWKIHKKLSERKLNRINLRKEFFEVTLEEIESIINEFGIKDVKFTYTNEAKQYRQSLAIKKEFLI